MTDERDTRETVRGQYEAYPYPPRDPADEAKRLLKGSPSNLAELNHYVFGGRRDFREPFRALVAGCGTGDGAIMLAQQLATAGCPAEVVCLDLSDAALRVVEARAGVRGLRNLRFHRASLLDLGHLGLGRFDYIDCCGVLHHLDDPPAGLAALRQALAPGGGIGLMVYAPLGRAGVYEVQGLLRLLGRGLGQEERIDLALATLDALPAVHPFKRNPVIADHRGLGRAGIVDLLLHARDRAYFVPELLALVSGAGLAVSGWIEPARYRPENYVEDAGLKERLAVLAPEEAWAAAELIAGSLKKHVCYLVEPEARESAPARPDSPEAIPLLGVDDPAGLARRLGTGGGLVLNYDGVRMRFALPAQAAAIIAAIDGRRTLAEIHAALRPPFDSYDRFKAAFDAVYAAFNGANAMLLRYAV
ncbi:MAG: class I SAM-dependent methyltransferase [Alphaproteobacteria bacterium]